MITPKVYTLENKDFIELIKKYVITYRISFKSIHDMII